jgi:hypothetical protein
LTFEYPNGKIVSRGQEATDMPWELYKRQTRPSPKDPMVTLSKLGLINLNSAVTRNIVGEHKFAHLLFDREKHLIGIQFLKQRDADAYPIRLTKSRSNGSIAGVSFLKTYNIYPSETKAYNASFDETNKVLVVDLSDKKKEGEQPIPKRKGRF